MQAKDAEVGKKYINKKGTPVTMRGYSSKGDKIILKVEPTGTLVEVPKNYELTQFNEARIDRASKMLIKSPKNGMSREGTLASIIDPYLLSGTKTVKEIVAELERKAGAAAKGKNFEANVRARMWVFKTKGWRVVKDEKKHVRVIQKM